MKEYSLPTTKIKFPAHVLFHPAVMNLPNPHALFFTFCVGNMDAENKYVFNIKTVSLIMKVASGKAIARYIAELEEQRFIKDITKEVGAERYHYVIKVLDEKNWGYKPEIKKVKKDQANIIAELIDEMNPDSLENARLAKIEKILVEETNIENEIARSIDPSSGFLGRDTRFIELKKKVILRWHEEGLLKGQIDELDSIVNRIIRNELPHYRVEKGKIKFERDRSNMSALDLLERAYVLAKEPSITANPEKHRVYLKAVLQKMYPNLTEEQIKVKVNAFIEEKSELIKNSNPVVMEIPKAKPQVILTGSQ